MTNGSSQGLFLIVSVVIFGLFVAISYVLFKDNLQTSLASIFKDSTEEAFLNSSYKELLLSSQKNKVYEGILGTEGAKEYVRIDDVDLSILGDNNPEDTVYEIKFTAKTKYAGTFQAYAQNSSSWKYKVYSIKDVTKRNHAVFVHSEGNDVYKTYKEYFTLTEDSLGDHQGKSLLSFYSRYGTGNAVTVKDIEIRRVNK